MDFVKYHDGDGSKMEREERRFALVTIPSDGHLFESRGISLARSLVSRGFLRRHKFDPGISQVPPFCEMCFASFLVDYVNVDVYADVNVILSTIVSTFIEQASRLNNVWSRSTY